MSKAQSTLFVILGLLLLLSVALYIGSTQIPRKPTETAKTEITTTAEDLPIKNFVDSCVAQTAKMGVFFFGFIGGDVNPPAYESFFSYDERYKIPYLYNEGNTIDVTKDFVENTLVRYMDTKLEKCTGSFSNFKLDITTEKPKTKVQLLENEVVFSVSYPININRDGKRTQVGPEFLAKIPVRLKEMVQITNKLVEMKKEDSSLIHWDYLTEVNKNYNATAYTEVDSTIVYRLIDTKNEVLGEPYVFQFAVKIK